MQASISRDSPWSAQNTLTSTLRNILPNRRQCRQTSLSLLRSRLTFPPERDHKYLPGSLPIGSCFPAANLPRNARAYFHVLAVHRRIAIPLQKALSPCSRRTKDLADKRG